MRGVETATSTPQESSNIHSFLGWLTRATTRDTPNSVLASRETTKLTLSSPVAATTTSHCESRASSKAVISQASAMRVSAPSTIPGLAKAASRSSSRISCPFCSSSRAIARPTLPAPAIATLMNCPSRGTARCLRSARDLRVEIVGARSHPLGEQNLDRATWRPHIE